MRTRLSWLFWLAYTLLVLAQHFLTRAARRTRKAVIGMNEHAARLFLDYDWPGNVRELENCIERAAARVLGIDRRSLYRRLQ